MVLTLDEYRNGQTLAPSATLMSDAEVEADVRDYFGRSAQFVGACGLDEAGMGRLAQSLVQLHKHYYQGLDQPWACGARAGLTFGPPRPWTGAGRRHRLDARRRA